MWELSARLLSMMLCYDPSSWAKLVGPSPGADQLDPRNCSQASPHTFLQVLWRLSPASKCNSSEQPKAAALTVHVSAASPATDWRPGSRCCAAARFSYSCLVWEGEESFLASHANSPATGRRCTHRRRARQRHPATLAEALRIGEGGVCHLS